MKTTKTTSLVILALLPFLAVVVTSVTYADDGLASRKDLEEPVLRVAKATPPSPQSHPLDPALELARTGLEEIRTSIRDYTATMVKRERVDGELLDFEYMFIKVRNRKTRNNATVTPLAVYMYFLKPATIKGREVLFVEGQNDGKLVAHEGGTAGKYLPTVWLRPTGVLAMRGQRYPITEVGIENLVAKLIERGEQDRATGRKDVEVTLSDNAKINGRVCTLLQVKNHVPSPNLDFHLAQIFIDKELNVPIRYAAYDFPIREGGPMQVLEEYTYLNLKVNVGLTDKDFDHNNGDYNF